jgi:hypothetical protein
MMVTIRVTSKIKGTKASDQRMSQLPREDLTVAELIAQAMANGSGLEAMGSPEQAQQAFRDSVYTLIVDGEQACKLDEVLHLHPASNVTFLHLTT